MTTRSASRFATASVCFRKSADTTRITAKFTSTTKGIQKRENQGLTSSMSVRDFAAQPVVKVASNMEYVARKVSPNCRKAQRRSSSSWESSSMKPCRSCTMRMADDMMRKKTSSMDQNTLAKLERRVRRRIRRSFSWSIRRSTFRVRSTLKTRMTRRSLARRKLLVPAICMGVNTKASTALARTTAASARAPGSRRSRARCSQAFTRSSTRYTVQKQASR
mmetsp:Transcript_14821/g.46655  ORF Transcript_14821/g.46655 Transcript_14821/m.46655 type:complete len:220 (-) Transcript_14821:398-1057(-)